MCIRDRDIQRDAVRSVIEHVDLLTVVKGEKITVVVPIRVVGESAPGTIHLLEMQSAHIEAEATNLPDHLEVSVEGLVAGVTLRAADLQMPAGVIYLGDLDDVIVAISVPQSEEEPEEVEAGEPTEAALGADASDEEA